MLNGERKGEMERTNERNEVEFICSSYLEHAHILDMRFYFEQGILATKGVNWFPNGS